MAVELLHPKPAAQLEGSDGVQACEQKLPPAVGLAMQESPLPQLEPEQGEPSAPVSG